MKCLHKTTLDRCNDYIIIAGSLIINQKKVHITYFKYSILLEYWGCGEQLELPFEVQTIGLPYDFIAYLPSSYILDYNEHLCLSTTYCIHGEDVSIILFIIIVLNLRGCTY